MNDDLVWAEPQSPEEIMDGAIREHRLQGIYVLFSGGKDSSSVDHFVATEYPELYRGRVFTNTTIADPKVRRFVIEDSKRLGRPLHMTWPRRTFQSIVLEHGFPGAPAHRIIMAHLKFFSWRDFMDQRLRGERIAMVSGIRKKESMVRDKVKFYSKKPLYWDGPRLFISPFLYKNGSQLLEYFTGHGLRKSPAYEYMDISGECLCGCYASPWELKGLESGSPFVFESIRWLEREVQATIRALESLDCPSDEDRETLRKLKASPYWGRGGGTAAAEAQSVMEDYCGESCQAG